MNADYNLNMNADYNLNFLQFFSCKLISDRIRKTTFNHFINLFRCQNADIIKYAYYK